MKNTVTLILGIVIAISAIVLSKYFEIKEQKVEIKTFNMKYEKYQEKDVPGNDIATVINQAIDDNEKAFVKKDEKGNYIQDDEKSVNIQIQITDLSEDKIYTMETLYNGGMSDFVKYYGQINFKCNKIEYNSKGRVKYVLFRQNNSN